MLFNKNKIKRFETLFILLLCFGVITTSCSRRKIKPQKTILSSHEFPTKQIPFNCKKTFESLTLLLRTADLKRVSYKNKFIKTHWIDNTFAFFSREKDDILEKSAKFRLYLKGKTPSKAKNLCKLTIFKNQKVKYDHSSPWVSTTSDSRLENDLFSKLTEGVRNQSDDLPEEDLNDEPIEEDNEEDDSESKASEESSSADDLEDTEDTEDTEDIEDIEDIESIENIESIEKVESTKKEKSKTEDEDEEESIESIESLES